MDQETKETYRPIVIRKYAAVLKSCRNLISRDDIRQIRRAFDIAIKNEKSADELNYKELIRILDIDYHSGNRSGTNFDYLCHGA